MRPECSYIARNLNPFAGVQEAILDVALHAPDLQTNLGVVHIEPHPSILERQTEALRGTCRGKSEESSWERCTHPFLPQRRRREEIPRNKNFERNRARYPVFTDS